MAEGGARCDFLMGSLRRLRGFFSSTLESSQSPILVILGMSGQGISSVDGIGEAS